MDLRLQRWMYAAAGYNALWGIGVVVFAGPVAWKCVGMMVACYAQGYWWAARRLLPEIVAVGLLGKLLGPIGFVWATARLCTGGTPTPKGACTSAPMSSRMSTTAERRLPSAPPPRLASPRSSGRIPRTTCFPS